MTRHLLAALIVLSAAGLAAPAAGDAQTFKVEKFDIKGEGGTDYVVGGVCHRPRVRLAGDPHDGGRRRNGQGDSVISRTRRAFTVPVS